MATTPAQQPASTNGPADKSPAESIDQVRELLFGGHMRTFESKIQSLAERFARETAELRADYDRRLAELDAAHKAEFARHADQLHAERDKRVEELKTLTAELTKTSQRISGELDRITNDLKADKLDSSALAAGLTELASRLGTTRSR